MNLYIDLQQLITQYLAPHRRRKNRLTWLKTLTDLEKTFNDFFEWRDKYRYETAVTSQIFVLENHLNRKFGHFRFAVRNYPDILVPLGNNDESEFYRITLDSDTESENYYKPFALTGETSVKGDSHFYVEVSGNPSQEKTLPVILHQKTKNLIRIEVDKYKQANKKFDIITKGIKEE